MKAVLFRLRSREMRVASTYACTRPAYAGFTSAIQSAFLVAITLPDTWYCTSCLPGGRSPFVTVSTTGNFDPPAITVNSSRISRAGLHGSTREPLTWTLRPPSMAGPNASEIRPWARLDR